MPISTRKITKPSIGRTWALAPMCAAFATLCLAPLPSQGANLEGCTCHGAIADAVNSAFDSHPNGGAELSDAIASVVGVAPGLSQDVICRAQTASQDAAAAAGAGLAAAPLNFTQIGNWICCGAPSVLESYYNEKFADFTQSAPQCFAGHAGGPAAGLLTPNFSGFGNAGGVGGAGSGGAVTQAAP